MASKRAKTTLVGLRYYRLLLRPAPPPDTIRTRSDGVRSGFSEHSLDILRSLLRGTGRSGHAVARESFVAESRAGSFVCLIDEPLFRDDRWVRADLESLLLRPAKQTRGLRVQIEGRGERGNVHREEGGALGNSGPLLKRQRTLENIGRGGEGVQPAIGLSEMPEGLVFQHIQPKPIGGLEQRNETGDRAIELVAAEPDDPEMHLSNADHYLESGFPSVRLRFAEEALSGFEITGVLGSNPLIQQGYSRFPSIVQ